MFVIERKRCWQEARADPPDSSQPGMVTGGVVEHSKSFKYVGRMSKFEECCCSLVAPFPSFGRGLFHRSKLPNRLSPGGHGGVRGGGIAGGGRGSR